MQKVTSKIKVAIRSGLLACCFLASYAAAQSNEQLNKQIEQLRDLVQNNEQSVTDKINTFQDYFTKNPDLYYESAFLNVKAYNQLLKQNIETAYEVMLEARSKAEVSVNEPAIAESYRIEGAILDTIGEYGAALDALNKAFSLYDRLHSKKVLGVYSSLSNVYLSLNDHQGMLTNAYRQLAAAQEYGVKVHEGLAYYRIGHAQTRLGKYLDASVNLDLSEKILKQENYPFIGIIYLALARLNVAQGNLDDALKRISQSIESDRKVEFLYNEVPRLLLLAEIYQLQSNTDKAIAELSKSVNNQALQKDKIQFLNILQRLIELTRETGDSASQLKFLEQYNKLYKQSFNEQQAQSLALNNVRLNVFEKEKEIKLLQKENELQVQRNLVQEQNNQYQLVFILMIFITLLLVSVLLVRTWRQREQLNAYSKELKQATKAKSDFLARMSHEIRTPINAISGLTKLMQRTAENPQDKTNLRQIDDASQSLMGVINDILDFSKIEAGKLDIETTSFQLDKVVSQSIRLQSVKAHEKNIELIQHIARDVPLCLRGDGLRIQQILVNLLSNAVKFTDDGLVSVTVKRKKSEQGVLLDFAVTDTGIGLSQAQIDRLFQSFTQVDESISRRYGGTGLGLAICKQLSELMGGEIWVESRVDEGSTFHFVVQLEEDTNQHIQSPSKKLSALKVLVADDVSLSRQAISEALLYANIRCELADGGQETLNKMRLAQAHHSPYDILILDWKMPDIDGLEVAAIINQEFQKDKPKIIMLSAFDFAHMKEHARHLGIKMFIEKPFSASELINKLQELAFNIKVDSSLSFAKIKNAPDLSNKRLLLAEDNKVNQKVAMGFLKDTKAEIVVAENGLEAIDMVRNQANFDCILMDVQMPEMDGLAATKVLRNELNFSMPIIAMTAHAMKQDMEKSAAAGMTAHIAKPIDPEYLYQVLAEVLLTSPPASSTKIFQPVDNKYAAAKPNPLDDLLLMDQQKAMDMLFVDEDYFRSMLVDFVEKESTVEALDSLIKRHDYSAIYRIAHDAVPTLTYIGAYNLAELAKIIEAALYDENQFISDELIEQLVLFQRSLNELVAKVKRQLAA